MDEIVDQLLTRIKKNGVEVWIAGEQSERSIDGLEHALALQLPPSYRNFIKRFGALGVADSFISGISEKDPLAECTGNLVWDTERFRRDFKMPNELLVFQAHEDAPYCLDTRARRPDGECPVVCFELHSKHIARLDSTFLTFAEWFVVWLTLRDNEKEKTK